LIFFMASSSDQPTGPTEVLGQEGASVEGLEVMREAAQVEYRAINHAYRVDLLESFRTYDIQQITVPDLKALMDRASRLSVRVYSLLHPYQNDTARRDQEVSPIVDAEMASRLYELSAILNDFLAYDNDRGLQGMVRYLSFVPRSPRDFGDASKIARAVRQIPSPLLRDILLHYFDPAGDLIWTEERLEYEMKEKSLSDEGAWDAYLLDSTKPHLNRFRARLIARFELLYPDSPRRQRRELVRHLAKLLSYSSSPQPTWHDLDQMVMDYGVQTLVDNPEPPDVYRRRVEVIGRARDRQHRQELAESERANHTDGLTQVLNRAGWDDLLERNVSPENPRRGTVVMLDLNSFKAINDAAVGVGGVTGHALGDMVLRETARVIQAVLRPDDGFQLARLGGDEFALFSSRVFSFGDLSKILERIDQAIVGIVETLDLKFARSFTSRSGDSFEAGEPVPYSTCMGVALSGSRSPSAVVHEADEVMLVNKTAEVLGEPFNRKAVDKRGVAFGPSYTESNDLDFPFGVAGNVRFIFDNDSGLMLDEQSPLDLVQVNVANRLEDFALGLSPDPEARAAIMRELGNPAVLALVQAWQDQVDAAIARVRGSEEE
jgi:diguanylate cyclase (GGDEF)-like protein